MKSRIPSLPLVLIAGAFGGACGGATEINYVEESGGSAGDAGNAGIGGTGGNDTGGAGGSSSGGTGGETTTSGGSGGGGTGGGTGGGGTAGDTSTSTSGGSGGGGSSSVSSGGVSSVGGAGGTGGSGGSGGDPGCLATGCPAGQYCDGDTRECNDLKAPGEACERSQECDDLLDCLDGVCCNEDECPACQNCGGDGNCSVTVAESEDLTGDECMDESSCDSEGACKLVLGQSCYSDDECVSGYCLDGVCCGDSACPECYNCGADGACSVAVRGTDDVTSECSGISTCDDGGECTPRWSAIALIDVSEEYVPIYSTSVGETFYFANANGYHIAYDLSSGMVSDAPLNDDYCWCGYTGAAVSDGTSMFYFANNGRMWTPGVDTAWYDVPTYFDAYVRDGEGAVAVTGGRVYRVGGREYEDRLSYFEIATGTFVTEGLPDHPEGGVAGNACGGAANGKVYVFGWSEGGFSEYDPMTNMWTEVTSDPNAPYCWGRNVPAWGSYLVYADSYGSEIKLLDTYALAWKAEGIPLPDPANLTTHIALVVGDQLYIAAYEPDADQIHIYQYMLADADVGSGF